MTAKPILVLRRRGCRCPLGIIDSREGELYIAAEVRASVQTRASAGEFRTMRAAAHPLNEAHCPFTLGCRHGRLNIHSYATSSEIAVSYLVDKAKTATRLGTTLVLG